MRDSSKRQADVDIEELEQDANDESNETVTLGYDVEMGAGSQGEHAPGLSGINVAESRSSPRATQPKTITRSKESSIMNIASVCPLTGICHDFAKLEERNRAVSRLCSEKPGTTPVEKILTQPLSWRLDERKLHTTKRWERHEGSDITVHCQNRAQANRSTVERHQQGRSVQRQRSQPIVGKGVQQQKCDDLFGGTPLVEAMRAIISMAASGATPKTLMTVDVSRAYMYAKCRNEMYVELCPEAYEEDGDEKCCWSLEKAMYGTRSAAQDWQHEIKRRMLSIGYLQGKSNPCLFYNPSSEVACPHHQDKTGKGFRGWRDTYDTNLGVYYGMRIKARQMRSLVSLTVTGLDAKEHADPPPVDACCGGHTLSKCGVGHKPW